MARGTHSYNGRGFRNTCDYLKDIIVDKDPYLFADKNMAFVLILHKFSQKYHKISNIWRTKSQNLNHSCLVMKLSLSNPLKPGVKSRMKM